MQQTERERTRGMHVILLFAALSVCPLLGWPGALPTARLVAKAALEVNYWYRNSGDVGAEAVGASHIVTYANGRVV